MWDLDYEESWAPKNWCFWTLALEKMLESPLGCKEIQPVHPKGVFIGKNSPGCSLERLILKLKLHYFGHFMQRTDSFEKTLESPLDSKEIQLVHPKGNQPWIFIGRSDVGAETPILWPPDVKNWLTGKTPDAGKDLKAGGEGDDRGWDGWMASPTRWTWVWVSSGSWG